MPATGVTPGIRRPVRTITLPPIASRRIRFGLPTSSAPSGVIVAALIPNPVSSIASAASAQTRFSVARRFASERSKRIDLELDPEQRRVEHPQRLLEQLLAGLVALERDYPQRGHGLRNLSA